MYTTNRFKVYMGHGAILWELGEMFFVQMNKLTLVGMLSPI